MNSTYQQPDNTVNILLLEDNPSDTELIRQTLKRAEMAFNLVAVDQEKDFLAHLHSGKTDVVISDYNLPGYDGLKALEATNNFDKALPFIFNTGALGDEEAVATIKKGATDFLLKDNMAKLPSVLLRAINEHQEKVKRAEAEQKLLSQSREFKMLLENSSDGIVLYDETGRIEYASPSVEQMLDYEPEEIIGSSAREFTHIDDLEACEQSFLDVLQEKSEKVRLEQRVLLKNGRYTWVEAIFSKYTDTNKKPKIVSNFRDISERKQKEEQLKDQKIQLNERVKELGCLHNISKIIDQYDPLEQILQEIVEVIPSGFQIPEKTSVRLSLDDATHFSSNFQETSLMLQTPVEVEKQQAGWVEIFLHDPEASFLEEEKNLLDSIAERIGKIAARNYYEKQLKEDDAFINDILNALTSNIAVLDQAGNIEKVNKSWQKFAETNNSNLHATGKSNNYFEACEKAVATDDPYAKRAVRGIGDVMKGKKEQFTLEYPCHAPNEERWFLLKASLLGDNQQKVVVAHENITEIKLAREELLFHSHILENIQNGIYSTDLEGRITYWNNGAELIFGYSESEMAGRPISTLFPDHEEQMPLKAHDRLNKESDSQELKTLTKAGAPIWVDVKTTHLKNKDGEITGYIGLASDITGRKTMEITLQANERKLKNITNTIPGIVYRYRFGPDGEGEFEFLSEGVSDILEYPKETLLKAPEKAWENVHPDDREQLKQSILNSSKHLSKWNNEFRVYTASGDMKWIRGRAIGERDPADGSLVWDGIFVDTTDQKTAEKALARSEQMFRQLFQNAPVGIVLLSNKNEVIDYNNAFQELFRFTYDDFKNNNINTVIVPEDKIEEAQILSEQVIKDEPIIRETYRLKKDGTKIPVLVYGVPVFMDKTLVYIYGIYIDISVRKQAEDDLKAQTQQLLRTNAELEQFAYVTSHNLRAPVVNLSSLMEMFDIENSSIAENKVIYGNMKKSVHKLNDTLNDLINIVAKKQELSKPKESISFETVLEEVKLFIHNSIEEARAEIQTDFSQAPKITYIKSFMQSILQNLLTNAIKYRNPAQVPQINIRTQREKDYVVLRISDNGQGINLERFGHRIFELFQRFHDDPHGKGLGLYLVKSQVENLGGKIEVDSELGKGTTFHIYLKDFSKGAGTSPDIHAPHPG